MRPRPPAATLGVLATGLALAAGASMACGPGPAAEARTALRINGSTTVNPVVAEAAEALRDAHGLTILVDTQGGSSGGVSMLAEGRVEIGTSSKPLDADDRARHPHVDFVEYRIGEDAVALVVSADVWDAGVRSISRDALRAIYEGRLTSWTPLGGPDRRIAFFDKEPGRGTWEVFATWLYGSASAAPAASFPQVGGNEETRNKVASTPGAMSQLSYAWADGRSVFALALEQDGATIAPTPATIASGAYPLSRPLLLLTDGPPEGDARVFVEFVRSPAGQALVRKHGYLALDDLDAAR